MTWLDSFFSWLSNALGLNPAYGGFWVDLNSLLANVGESNPWMVALWNLFNSILAMFFALAPMAPAIFIFLAVMAVMASVDKLSPDPIIDFVMMLYEFSLAVIGTVAAVIDMVIPL